MNTRRKFHSVLAAGLLVMGLAGALNAHASVVIAGTRVIYNAQEREITIKLTNEGKAPALTQVWIDKGDPAAAPASINVPFTVTPPVTRIDPAKGQTLRILYTGEALPQDVESVFWLNVLEIPPKQSANEADANKLQLAFRSRIKLFFRPAALKGSPQEAPAQITWRIVQSGKSLSVEARNPTPYHVSFARMEVTSAGKTAKFDDGGMVRPGETKTFPLAGELNLTSDIKIHYQAINDQGGATVGEAVPVR
ncbi:fimbria/pilus periplasmic chaperone [Achromobacter seleniivolatilans]|uniref:Fimbria/pilus periplasmic chaperone n=1 Tax=Achromobacter seleniivolatilans TaxID=3047478 RepID=A0ABY9LVD5_9BURK|nr:fimbria/pilus periplasmic chaperone [Achromobacter sp. R39]WMD18511.1 fimbria/pilus periplasmic chaperone [Achromobacter sp. R39]